MSGALSKAWWLLALCGILDAMHAAINLLMMNLPLIFRSFGSPSVAVRDMGLLALSAGACAIAAALWSAGKDHSWLLSLHGLALAAFGAIPFSPLIKGPLSFRPVSLLFTVMAASIGAFALETLKAQRRDTRGRWFLIAAGVASVVLACSFVAEGLLRLLPVRRLEPTIFFSWMSSHFALCAVFMLWLALRLHSQASRQSDHTEPLSPLPSPRHAH